MFKHKHPAQCVLDGVFPGINVPPWSAVRCRLMRGGLCHTYYIHNYRKKQYQNPKNKQYIFQTLPAPLTTVDSAMQPPYINNSPNRNTLNPTQPPPPRLIHKNAALQHPYLSLSTYPHAKVNLIQNHSSSTLTLTYLHLLISRLT